MALPTPPLNFNGGDAQSASGGIGDTIISQGGLNVPAYPVSLLGAPIDADLANMISYQQGQPIAANDDFYYYAAAGFLLLMVLKKRWK